VKSTLPGFVNDIENCKVDCKKARFVKETKEEKEIKEEKKKIRDLYVVIYLIKIVIALGS